jgi:hypothetical protein
MKRTFLRLSAVGLALALLAGGSSSAFAATHSGNRHR